MPPARERAAPGADVRDLRSRGDALRQAAAVPGAKLRPLLDAALAELESAVSALSAAAARHPDGEADPAAAAARTERQLLRAVFQQAPVALFLLGQDGAVRRANQAAAELIGASPGYATGKLFTALVDPPSRAAVQSQLAAAARTGETSQLPCALLARRGRLACELTVRPVSVRGDDDRMVVAVTRAGAGQRAAGDKGGPKAAIPGGNSGRAPTTRRGAPDPLVRSMTERLDLVHAANKLLLENVAAAEAVLIQRLARLLADHVAAWAIVDIHRDGTLRRHTVMGPEEEETQARASAVLEVDRVAESAAGRVAESGSTLLLAHAEDHDLLGVTAAGMPVFLLLGGASVLSVPIAAAGVGYGALTLVRRADEGAFALADAGFAEETAEQLARAITAHRLIERRTTAAEALQGSMLPRELRTIPGVEVAAAHLAPTHGPGVGGDFYDLYPTPDGWGIAIGDVCGKSQDAAAVTAAARHAIRVLAYANSDPARVLREANDIMLAEALGGTFVTADAAHLSWRDGRLHVVLGSAGHPGPVLVTKDGRARAIEGGGVPLGIFRDGACEIRELDLEPGDVLFFCTDGLADARGAEMESFGDVLADRLAALAGRSPADLIAALQQHLLEFCAGKLLDDVTMFALRAADPPAG